MASCKKGYMNWYKQFLPILEWFSRKAYIIFKRITVSKCLGCTKNDRNPFIDTLAHMNKNLTCLWGVQGKEGGKSRFLMTCGLRTTREMWQDDTHSHTHTFVHTLTLLLTHTNTHRCFSNLFYRHWIEVGKIRYFSPVRSSKLPFKMIDNTLQLPIHTFWPFYKLFFI